MPGPTLERFGVDLLVRRWDTPEEPDFGVVDRLAAELRLPPALCRLLAQRGHGDADAAKRFLRPRPGDLHSHAHLRAIDVAAERIARAVSSGEVILVHGDYDVDGICGAAMLTRAIRMMGGRVLPFVPNRLEHGYDLRDAGIAAARSANASLIVTVDCGIVAHQAVLTAAAEGIDVIVTDHHTPSDQLPSAVAVVNPNRRDCDYPEKGLAGAAVAFKIAQAVAAQIDFPNERLASLIDLVAIATVADLVPLTSENRAIVRWGLSVLNKSPNPGLRALVESSGLAGRPEITAGQVGFVLAPRINAVGRVGDPMVALRLLLTDEPAEAKQLAAVLEEQNNLRREMDQQTLAEALEMIDRDYDPDRDWGVVLASEDWHPGVIGIVASRVVERIHRPTFLLAVGAAEAKGSGRSIPGFHLYQALAECAPLLDRFGGHRMAAGCSLLPERVEDFREAFNAAAHAQLAPEDLSPRLRIDGRLEIGEATEELLGFLRHFAPFGVGNPTPVFSSTGVRVSHPREVGRGHLRADLQGGSASLEAIGFDMADRLPELSGDGDLFDVAFRLETNEWTGRDGRLRRTIQARLVDFRGAA